MAFALHMSDAVAATALLLACIAWAVVLDVSGLAAREARSGTVLHCGLRLRDL